MSPRTIALALLLASPAAAQTEPATAPATAPLSPAAQAAARELFETSNVRTIMRESIDKTVALMRSGGALSAFIDQNPQMRMKRAENPQAWDAALKRLGEKQAAIMEKIFAEMQPDLEAMTIQLYGANFSVDELKAMTVFYKTPLGRKIVERMPAVTGQTMAWMQSEIPKRIAPAMSELQPEIQRELTPLMSAPKAP